MASTRQQRRQAMRELHDVIAIGMRSNGVVGRGPWTGTAAEAAITAAADVTESALRSRVSTLDQLPALGGTWSEQLLPSDAPLERALEQRRAVVRPVHGFERDVRQPSCAWGFRSRHRCLCRESALHHVSGWCSAGNSTR
jgi:hypothetical protein